MAKSLKKSTRMKLLKKFSWRQSIKALFIVFSINLGAIFVQPVSAHQVEIINSYKDWKSSQLKAGNYLPDSDCNIQGVRERIQTGRRVVNQGFGTAAFSYGDINRDGRQDALVVFNPRQCDGGNALMNSQTAIVILSNNGSSPYLIEDKKLENLNGLPTGMWKIFESVKESGTITGTAYGYTNKDARCCPSIKRSFTYTYPGQSLKLN